MSARPYIVTAAWMVAGIAVFSCAGTGAVAFGTTVLDSERSVSTVGEVVPGAEQSFERGDEGGGHGGSTERWLRLRMVPPPTTCTMRVESGGAEVARVTNGSCELRFASHGRPYVVHASTSIAGTYVEVERLESEASMRLWHLAALVAALTTVLAAILTKVLRREEPPTVLIA